MLREQSIKIVRVRSRVALSGRYILLKEYVQSIRNDK